MKESGRATEITYQPNTHLDKIRGCMIGGAAGDALGYAVEFDLESEIFSRYGEEGITEYEFDTATGKALISDDTQMALFTANGILFGETRLKLRGIGGKPSMYMLRFYQDWLKTQDDLYQGPRNVSWLLDVPELYARRAPGNTCMSALYNPIKMKPGVSYVESKVNDSKGCGAVMRIAPLGIHYRSVPIESLMEEAAEISAITHGHELGYIPSATLTFILNRIVYSEEKNLDKIVIDAINKTRDLYEAKPSMPFFCELLGYAVVLSKNKKSDLENIHELGEGWVAEEALAIAVYCALKYRNNFSKCIIAAVNHDGDSDSTGAIAGNIIGAYLGYEAIDKMWIENLELYDVIMEISDDLFYGCRRSDITVFGNSEWERKYIKKRAK